MVNMHGKKVVAPEVPAGHVRSAWLQAERRRYLCRPVFGHIQSALIEDRNTICRTVQICHDSRTNSGARTIFDAYHSLASKLQLKPLADFVHVSQQHKQTCIRNGCCCSSPVTVQVSIPLTGDEAADLKNLAILADFDKLPKQLAGAFCSGQLKECYQPLSMERRRLLR